MVSEGMAPEVDQIPDPSLYAARSARGIYIGASRFSGPLVVRLNYEGAILKLLRGVLGGGTTAVVETTARDHTFKEAATLPSMSLEVCKGDIPTSKVLHGLGAKVKSLKLSGGVGDSSMALCEAQFMGKDLDPNTGTTPAGYTPTASVTVSGGGGSISSPIVTTSGDFFVAGFAVGMPIAGTNVGAGAVILSFNSATSLNASVNNAGTVSGTITGTLAYPGVLPVLASHCTDLNDGVDAVTYPGGVLRLRRWSVTIENPMEERLYVGSANPDEPLPSDRLKVTWEFQHEYQTLKAYQAARLLTNTTPKIIFKDATTIGASSKREFEVRSNKAVATYSNPVEGYGLVLATSTHQAYYDATDASSVVVRVRSLDGSI